MIEIVIKVSGEDITLNSKYLLHEEGLCLSHQDATLKAMVEETCAKLKVPAEDVMIKIKYIW